MQLGNNGNRQAHDYQIRRNVERCIGVEKDPNVHASPRDRLVPRTGNRPALEDGYDDRDCVVERDSEYGYVDSSSEPGMANGEESKVEKKN